MFETSRTALVFWPRTRKLIDFFAVESAGERSALVAKGVDATRVVAREDLRQALTIG